MQPNRSEEVQEHLRKVYSLLFVSLIASVVGSWYQIQYELMTEYGSCILAQMKKMQHTKHKQTKQTTK